MERKPKPWENHLVDHLNRLAPRADFSSYNTLEEALIGEKGSTLGYKSLNGMWKFLFLEAPEYAPEGFYERDFNMEEQALIQVPGSWQMQGFGKMHYADLWYNFPIQPPFVPTTNPTGVYARNFFLEESWRGKRIVLRFNGVDSFFQLWVNGKEIGQSKGARYQAEFDVTEFVEIGENRIVLMVTQWSDGTYLEDQDMWWLSGIFRDVELYAEPISAVEDFQIITKLDEQYEDAELQINAWIRDGSENKKFLEEKYTLTYMLLDSHGKTIFSEEKNIDKLEQHYRKKILRPDKWSAEIPQLYTLILILKKDKEIQQIIPQKIGFRRIEKKGAVLTLNGVPIKFKGVNRHDF